MQLNAGKRSLKEMSNLMEQLKRDNYELKLRLFHVEQREAAWLNEHSNGSLDLQSALSENVDLKIRLDRASRDVAERNELLVKSRAHISALQHELDDLVAQQQHEHSGLQADRSLSASTSLPPAPLLAQQLADARASIAQLRAQLEQQQQQQQQQQNSPTDASLRKLVQEQSERIAQLSYQLECRIADCSLAQQQLAAKSDVLAESLAAMEQLERQSVEAHARAAAAGGEVNELQSRLEALEREARNARHASDGALGRAVLALVNTSARIARGAAPIAALSALPGGSDDDDDDLLQRGLRACERDVERAGETLRNATRAQQQSADAARRAEERLREMAADAARRSDVAAIEATRRIETLTAQADERVRQADARTREALEREDSRVVRLQQQIADLRKLQGDNKENGAKDGNKPASAPAAADGDVDVEERLSNALQRVERLAANNRVLILELEEARKVTAQIAAHTKK